MLTFIDERLNELDREKGELVEFMESDKERRCLEYALYYRQQNDALMQLETLEEERIREEEEALARYKGWSDRSNEILALEREIHLLQATKKEVEIKKSQGMEDLNNLLEIKAKLGLSIREQQADANATNSNYKALEREKQGLVSELNIKNAELDILKPEFLELIEKEAAEREEVDNVQSRLNGLIAKKGQYEQFKTAADRDKYLQSTIVEKTRMVTSLQQEEKKMETEMETIQSESNALERELESQSNAQEASITELESSEANLIQQKQRKQDLEHSRK